MSPEALDYINGSFEMIGSYFTWRNAYQLYKDKKVKGVYLGTPIFFMIWGWWNIIYYQGLKQPYSLYAGVLLVLGNMIWIFLAFKYRKDD